MTRKITRFGLRRNLGELVTINREGKDITGHLHYGGDKGSGDGFLEYL